ncbi:hypothetical protein RIF29_19096 [Crotalaria pallida]|uniref:Uncharacterized protein n=1 Tax=Crotalaria pallida TaxID=3830 RepID=A0AAN9I578_CROPI
MSFLMFARNCACHITSLSASAIEELLQENWPNLLCAVYDLILISSTSIIYNKHRVCHNYISNDRDAIVVSKSGGKLGAIKGCPGRCFNHVGRDLIDLRNVVSRHLNLGSGNPNKFPQFLGDLRYETRYFAPATTFRLLAGHPIWMSPAARMHMRYAFYNKLKRLPTIDQKFFRKGCRSPIMLQQLQFGGWKSFAMNHDILKDVLTFHHKSRERYNLERNYDNYVDADESYLDSLSHGDRQEKLIMSFLRFARNCACHITSLNASAIEELLEENWPNLLCAAYDLISCSGRLRDAPVTVANGCTARISAVGISDSREAFANSSSLSLRWELGSCEGLANWDYASDSAKFNNWERFLVLQNESGLHIVRATVTGFPDSLGEDTFHEFPATENVLTDAIRLQLVSSLRVDLEFSFIYFNPNAQVNLSITCGSCFLEAITNDYEVVDVIQPPSGLQCLQLVLSPKGLGIANLTVYDIGLTPPLRAFALVQVADIEWIKIIPGEEISLMEGSSQTIHLSAGINDGSSFPASQFVYMNLHVHVEDSIIELVDTDNFLSLVGGHVNAPSFKKKGRHLGITTLYVSAVQHFGDVVQSQAIKVEVYACQEYSLQIFSCYPVLHMCLPCKEAQLSVVILTIQF